ncbi:Mis12 protein-domain-containing protein [Xylariaceae sp. FL0016]|nr:Mis12 protein-domain-containing protein [Xylariaceae sp. FL0016]
MSANKDHAPTMTASANSEQELLTEHFGYPPVSLIDDIINSVNILAERALTSVETGLAKLPPSALGLKAPKPTASSKSSSSDSQQQQFLLPDAIRTEIETGTHQLETLLCASIDRNFDKFEIYVLRNILCVRPPGLRDWMRLSHYEGLDFSSSLSPPNPTTAAFEPAAEDAAVAIATKNRDVPTLASIHTLRRKLRESMKLNALLHAERARNERLLDELRHLVGGSNGAALSSSVTRAVKQESTSSPSQDPNNANTTTTTTSTTSPFAFLHHKADLASAGKDPISTTTAFTLTQTSALRSLSRSLRTMTPDLVAQQQQHHPSTTKASPSPPDDHDHDHDNEHVNAGADNATARKKSWRRERAEYVEAATRRHLESVQGLELGRDGALRDGEWQGEGRGMAPGEVEGLERVVAMLGGGGEESAAAGAVRDADTGADADAGLGSSAPGAEDNEGEVDQGDDAMDQS